MSLALKLALRGALIPYLKAHETALERGAMAGAKTAGDTLKAQLRADTIGGGLGERVANAWRSAVYPQRGTSLTPSAVVWSRAAHIMHGFEDPAVIRGNSGFWLAIPTDAIPLSMRRGSRGFGRVTPGILEQRLGIRLRFVPAVKGIGRAGKLAYLVAGDMRQRKGKRGGFAPAAARARERGEVSTVIMFVLVPQVRLKKRLHIGAVADAMQTAWPTILKTSIDASLSAAVDAAFAGS